MSEAYPFQTLSEIISITTVDGVHLAFASAWLIDGFANFGAAPVIYQTQEGYKLIGSRVLDFTLSDRRMTILLRQHKGSNTRPEYWTRRNEIIDFFRPNRGTDGNEITLTINRPDGDGGRIKRRIQCRYENGLEFEDFDESVNPFAVDVAINLIAHNPIWEDATQTIKTVSSSQDTELVFPITFPIVFGESGLVFNTGDLDYLGTWRAYPTITITGPYSTAKVENLGTGVFFQLSVPILTGESRIITLSEQTFSIVDQSGNSKFDELDENSNLSEMYIPTLGEIISGGSQALKATLQGATDGVSGFQVEYNTAYYGV